MASVADSSTSLEAMKSANDDFVELILKLKSLLNSKDPVTFNMGKYSITVQTVLDLVSNYKDGKFDALYLGGQGVGKKVKLSVDANGTLCVTDSNGYKVSVSCEKLISSTIEQCYAKNVTAESASIRSIEGKTKVSGGSVKFGTMSFEELKTTNLVAQKVKVNSLSVGSFLNCEGVLVTGVRKFAPQRVRRMFYRNNAPLDDAHKLLDLNGGQWVMNAGNGKLSPTDFGFAIAEDPQSLKATSAVPDLIQICGNTKYASFNRKAGIFASLTPLEVPGNVGAYVADFNSSNYYPVEFNRSEYQFAALMAFPTGGYASAQGDYGALYITSFSADDVGKEVYYQTYENEWYIYRRMSLVVGSNGMVKAIAFGEYTKIPRYSCLRFIVGCIQGTDANTSEKTVTYTLELS